ncbi:MAG: PAS domain-containing protein [Pseudomonadota bacterium]
MLEEADQLEAARLAALNSCHILDTPPEPAFDRITRTAAATLGAPIALISFVDEARQWFKSRVGLSATETPRDLAFCAHAILGDDIFEISDATKDPRFSQNPLVTGAPNIRLYAGAPLKTSDGHNLGSLCVIDTEPRSLTTEQRTILTDLADLVINILEARRYKEYVKVYERLSDDITKIQAEGARSDKNVSDLFGTFLSSALSLTNSTYGFIGEITQDKRGVRLLKIHAVKSLAWDETTQTMQEKDFSPSEDFITLDAACDQTVTHPIPIVCNQPGTDEHIFSRISEHPGISAYLGAPLASGEKTLGVLGVANRPNGYDEQIVDQVRPLLAAIGNIIKANQADNARHAAENVLRQRTQYLELAEKFAGVGHWNVDLLESTLTWSEEIYRIHGVTPQTYTPDVPSAIAFYHPDDRAYVESAVERAITEEKPFELELRIVRPCGEIRHVFSKGECQTNADGEVISIFGIFQDISNRKANELQLKKSEERFSVAASGASVGIWDWIDVDQNAQWWSPIFYELLGYKDKEVPATLDNFKDFLHPDDHEQTFKAVQTHFEGGGRFYLEYRLKHKIQGYRWFLGSGQAIWDENGRPTRMIGSIMDIHELKTTQETLERRTKRLERSNQELDHFAYIASHDLRAPLRGMDNLTQWLEEDIGGDATANVQKNLGLLKNRVARMDRLLSDILAYSRAGKRDSAPEPTDCEALLYDIIDWSAPPPGLHVRSRAPLPTITISATLIEQTLLNLISNAVKHHDRQKGCITVGYLEHPNRHEFIVEDDGPGIDEKFQERIFKMFQTLERRDDVEGSGIGLAIVKKMVESAGGRIWLRSPLTDRGTAFHFTLPKLSVPDTPPSEDPDHGMWPTDHAVAGRR